MINNFTNLINKLCFHSCKFLNIITSRLCKTKDNYIVFESEGDFCDNPRALYEYMIKNNYNNRYKLIWIVKDPKKYAVNKNIVLISRDGFLFSTIKFFYYINASKFFLFSHPFWFTFKKSDQVIINLWHGIPIKNVTGPDISRSFDFLLCSSDNTKPWFNKFCGASDKQDIVLGSPRNDLLFEDNNSLRKLLGNKKYNKVILCMPTYKQTSNITDSKKILPYYIQNVYSKEDILNLNHTLSQLDIIFIVKIHHLQDTTFLKSTDLSNIIYVNDDNLLENNIQLYHLLSKADALLTDYSSVYLDYILLDRPIGFLLDDIKSYANGRGFLFDDYMNFMPGEKIYTYKDLIKFITNICENVDNYSKQRKFVRDYTNKYQDGQNCKRLLDYFNIT